MAERRWAVWSVQASDMSGVEVDEGTKAEARASAARRNESARKLGMYDVVFTAIPAGRQPSADDPPPPRAEPAGRQPSADDLPRAEPAGAAVQDGYRSFEATIVVTVLARSEEEAREKLDRQVPVSYRLRHVREADQNDRCDNAG
jgi:hypothetical protein